MNDSGPVDLLNYVVYWFGFVVLEKHLRVLFSFIGIKLFVVSENKYIYLYKFPGNPSKFL